MALAPSAFRPHPRGIPGRGFVAHIDFSDFDHRLRQWRLTLDLRTRRRIYPVIAGAIASLTIITIAATMMTQL
jgi:hypothetical protein